MRKARVAILVLIILIFLMTSWIMALGEIDLVTDEARLLTDNEYRELNKRALEISHQYKCQLAIITVNHMDHRDAYDYANFIREEYQMGYGDEKSILLLLLSMEARDYALIAYGYGNTAFTDHGKDVILDRHILPLLGKDKYYQAFSKYLDLSEEYLQMARAGSPFDINTDPDYGKKSLPIKLAVTFLVPALIAFAICQFWRSKMKTAVLARTASNYITQDGLVLTNRQDRFLYRTETRRTIEKKKSGGTTTDDKGGSGRSGKF